jgi:hypothetical protein
VNTFQSSRQLRALSEQAPALLAVRYAHSGTLTNAVMDRAVFVPRYSRGSRPSSSRFSTGTTPSVVRLAGYSIEKVVVNTSYAGGVYGPHNDNDISSEEIELSGDLPDGYMLRSPVVVELWAESGEYFADVNDLNLYAFGATPAQALENVRKRIVDRFRDVCGSGAPLAPESAADAVRLAELVAPPHA